MFPHIFVQHHNGKRHVEYQAGAAAGFQRLLNVQVSVRIVPERAGMAAHNSNAKTSAAPPRSTCLAF